LQEYILPNNRLREGRSIKRRAPQGRRSLAAPKLAAPKFKVVSVIDGDTIDVSVRGKVERVRLLAIDTPETKDPRKPVQCFGYEATNKMQSLVANKYIKLVDDRSQGNIDKYSRLLRYVYDGKVEVAQF
jgi:endonuclease YncB( thermonuclease family)